MIYSVEVGDIEVIVELIRRGDKRYNLKPWLEVDAGTDWDGNSIHLSKEDQQKAIDLVIENYPSEVWA